MPRYDLIVAGAGPAGGMAARAAAEAGISVLLLEKDNQIGSPVCCAEAVPKLSFENLITVKPEWIATAIESVAVYGPENSSCNLEHPNAGYVLERRLFDRDVALMAAAVGAEIKINTEVIGLLRENNLFTGVEVIENGNRRVYKAKAIIAADGVEGVIGRQAGINRTLNPKFFDSCTQFMLGGINIDPSCLEFYFDNELYPSGYLWVFPKSNGSANVGLGSTLINSNGVSQKELLLEFCRKRFGRFSIAERTSGGIPTFQGRKPLLTKNLMQVGDAARVLDSLTGAGIINAMLSGKIAGETAAEFIHSGCRQETLENYPKRFLSQKGKELTTYLRGRKFLAQLNNRDIVTVVNFIKGYFPTGHTNGINGRRMVLSLMRANPRFILLTKEILFG